jgi:hypothetical protein
MGTINRFMDAEYITQPQFQELITLAERCSRQISRFMTYLSTHSDEHRSARTESKTTPRLSPVEKLERGNIATSKPATCNLVEGLSKQYRIGSSALQTTRPRTQVLQSAVLWSEAIIKSAIRHPQSEI